MKFTLPLMNDILSEIQKQAGVSPQFKAALNNFPVLMLAEPNSLQVPGLSLQLTAVKRERADRDKQRVTVDSRGGGTIQAEISAVQQDDGTWTVSGLTLEQASLASDAPDLLEACKAFEGYYDGAPDSSTRGMAHCYQIVRAAIAKAEGSDQ